MVNHELSIGKRGTTGEKTDQRTAKTKVVVTSNAGSKSGKTVSFLDAAAEYQGTPYARVQCCEESTEIWSFCLPKVKFGALTLGDITVPESVVQAAFNTLCKHHAIFKELRKQNLTMADLQPPVAPPNKETTTKTRCGLAAVASRQVLETNPGLPQRWLRLEADK